MKKTSLLLAVLAVTLFSCSHAQNGPTVHAASLVWTNPASLTGNCIYRGTASGQYTKPALSCSSSPQTTYVDNAVTAGTTYYYAVTAQDNTSGVVEESGYSNEVQVKIPTTPAPPSLKTPGVALNKPPAVNPDPTVTTVANLRADAN